MSTLSAHRSTAASRYGAAQLAVATPHDLEIRAFTSVAHEIESATDRPSRAAALHRNVKLWSILEADLLHEGNALPERTKALLVSLALYARRESLAAMGDDRLLVPLVSLNREMAEALAASRNAARPAGAFGTA